ANGSSIRPRVRTLGTGQGEEEALQEDRRPNRTTGRPDQASACSLPVQKAWMLPTPTHLLPSITKTVLVAPSAVVYCLRPVTVILSVPMMLARKPNFRSLSFLVENLAQTSTHPLSLSFVMSINMLSSSMICCTLAQVLNEPMKLT